MGRILSSGEIGSVEFIKPNKTTIIEKAVARGDCVYLKTKTGKLICTRMYNGYHKKVAVLPHYGHLPLVEIMRELGMVTPESYKKFAKRVTEVYEQEELKRRENQLINLADELGYKITKQKKRAKK